MTPTERYKNRTNPVGATIGRPQTWRIYLRLPCVKGGAAERRRRDCYREKKIDKAWNNPSGAPAPAPLAQGSRITHQPCRDRRPRRSASVHNLIKPSPLGKVSRLAVTDEGIQVVGTAQCDALLTSIPHQSPTAPASPKGSLKNALTKISPTSAFSTFPPRFPHCISTRNPRFYGIFPRYPPEKQALFHIRCA